MKEHWKPVMGYEGFYEVSNTGLIRGIDRTETCGHRTRTRKGKNKKFRMHHAGYLRVQLSRNGIEKTELVHRVVALAFVPNPDKKPEVNHVDGNKSNNSANNLEWCTEKENIFHALSTGLMPTGSRAWTAKLNINDVRQIRELYGGGKTSRQIAKTFGVNQTTISDIVAHRTWK